MNSIIDDIKHSFKTGDTLIKLIYVNLGVFLVLQFLRIIGGIANINIFTHILNWLIVPNSLSYYLTKPWTLLSYFFVHESFFHLLSNLIWLYFFGKIFTEYLGGKRLLGVYFLGGIASGIVYLLLLSNINVFTGFGLMGASAAILAIVAATATYLPKLEVQMPLIGKVKILYIALFYLIVNISRTPSLKSTDFFVHISGALFGYLYIKQYQKGNDLTQYFFGVWNYIQLIFKAKPKIKVAYSNTQQKTKDDYTYQENKAEQKKIIDSILDKISKSGYESLSKQEKEILFSASNKK